MMDEEQCQSCRIVTGGMEEQYISEYREHRICSWCIDLWRRREKLVGHEISFEEFTTGKLKRGRYEHCNHK